MTTRPDEAEARVRELAAWFDNGDEGAEGSVLLSDSVAREAAADLLALLSMLDEARLEAVAATGSLLFCESCWSAERGTMIDRLQVAKAALAEERGRVAEWKEIAMPYIAVWATSYARERGLPDGHLYPDHYDNLAATGARMDDFTRATMGDRQ